MKIGELAKETGCSSQTIRFYEREGLLPAPHRSESNYRHYGQKHLKRLSFIRNCRALAMSHAEIHALLALVDDPRGDCQAIDVLLGEHIQHVEVRLEELSQLHGQLRSLQEKCSHASRVGDCGIVHGLEEMSWEEEPGNATHLG
ncbi:Cd(II)/Pb(II)-responsive transcriptional regulator [uncultured Kushneria sp.]|uniref:Cd(II)/Pb(II)-responsive transcriptional regulator n=1 Tax=uncultured Kushneria sp. TaxID=905033 RepID=UPI00261052F9|nr:Cd(II)/Pb(II)-responsive transcriptional regulator [uncultured Kushneria sp.]